MISEKKLVIKLKLAYSSLTKIFVVLLNIRVLQKIINNKKDIQLKDEMVCREFF